MMSNGLSRKSEMTNICHKATSRSLCCAKFSRLIRPFMVTVDRQISSPINKDNAAEDLLASSEAN